MRNTILVGVLCVLSATTFADSWLKITTSTPTTMTKYDGDQTSLTYQLTLSLPATAPQFLYLKNITAYGTIVSQGTQPTGTCVFGQTPTKLEPGQSCTVTYTASVPTLTNPSVEQSYHEYFKVVDALSNSAVSPQFALTVLPASQEQASSLVFKESANTVENTSVTAGQSKTITIANAGEAAATSFDVAVGQSISDYVSGSCLTTQTLQPSATCNLIIAPPSNTLDTSGTVTATADNAEADADLGVQINQLPRLAFESGGETLTSLNISTHAPSADLTLKNTGSTSIVGVETNLPAGLINDETQDHCNGQTLGAGETCSIHYNYSNTPITAGTYTITPSASGTAVVGVPLSVEVSSAGHITVQQNSQDITQLSGVVGATGSLTVANTGGSDITGFRLFSADGAYTFSDPSTLSTPCPTTTTGTLASGTSCVIDYTTGSLLGLHDINAMGSNADNIPTGQPYVLPTLIYNTWASTNGPEGADAQALLLDGSTLYAGVQQAGLFTSGDMGGNWQHVSTANFPEESVYRLAKMDNVLYAGTWSDGVYYKTTASSTWTSLPLPDSEEWVRSLYADTANNTLYVGLSNGKVYKRSNNLSASWEVVGTNTMSSGVYAMYKLNNILFAGTASNGLYTLTDGETTWVQNSTLTSSSVRAIAYFNSQLLVAYGSYVYILSDDSNDLPTLGGSVGSTILSINQWKGNIVVGTSNGIYQYDGVSSWDRIGTLSLGTLDLLPDGNDLYAAGYGSGEEGVYKFTDGGSSWSPVMTGMVATRVDHLAPADPNRMNADLFVGVEQYNESSEEWSQVDEANRPYNIHSMIANGPLLYVGTNSQVASINSGDSMSTWAQLGDSFDDDVDALAFYQATLYAGTSAGDIKAYQGSWQPPTNLGGAITALHGGMDALYAAVYGRGVYKFDGSSWTAINTGLPDGQNVNAFATDIHQTVYAALNTGIYQLSGSTWSLLPGSPTYVDSLYVENDALYAKSLFYGLYRYNSASEVWHPMSTGLPGVRAMSLSGTMAALYVGTYGRGVYKSALQ